jgi:hypothetical protein
VLDDNKENFIQSVHDSKLILSKINDWFAKITSRLLDLFLYIFLISLIIFLFYVFRKELKKICVSIFSGLRKKIICRKRLINADRNNMWNCFKRKNNDELIEMQDLSAKKLVNSGDKELL